VEIEKDRRVQKIIQNKQHVHSKFTVGISMVRYYTCEGNIKKRENIQKLLDKALRRCYYRNMI